MGGLVAAVPDSFLDGLSDSESEDAPATEVVRGGGLATAAEANAAPAPPPQHASLIDRALSASLGRQRRAGQAAEGEEDVGVFEVTGRDRKQKGRKRDRETTAESADEKEVEEEQVARTGDGTQKVVEGRRDDGEQAVQRGEGQGGGGGGDGGASWVSWAQWRKAEKERESAPDFVGQKKKRKTRSKQKDIRKRERKEAARLAALAEQGQ